MFLHYLVKFENSKQPSYY